MTAPQSCDPKAPCVTWRQPCQPESFCFLTPTTLSRDLVNLGTLGDFWVGFLPESFGLPSSSGRRVWFRENYCTTPHLWAYFKRKEETGISLEREEETGIRLEREEEAGAWLETVGRTLQGATIASYVPPNGSSPWIQGVQLPRVIGSLTEWEQDIPLM